MRSLGEYSFRFRQELANLLYFAVPPKASPEALAPLASLPDPQLVIKALAGGPFERHILELASGILEHRFPILGFTIASPPAIPWRRDELRGIETAAVYFRKIPYLDPQRAGDHKVVWELNRHQHLVVLAQAFRFSRDRRFLEELCAQLESWQQANPFHRGINWTSALEVAFRALSWVWVFHLCGAEFDPAFRKRFLNGLYRHGVHLRYNLSLYFSPNTHLLGEAVALGVLGRLFPRFPGADAWRRTASRIIEAEAFRQVRDDGSHFEQSAYYHVYTLDFLLFYYLVAGRPQNLLPRLDAMARYLASLTGPSWTLPLMGDDDGGRLFFPYGERDRFACATLATCAVLLNKPQWLRSREDLAEQAVWWLGPEALDCRPRPETGGSCLFSNSGVAVMRSGAVQVIADAGPFGSGSAGHSHSDTLSVVVRSGAEEVLIDPGTYTYVGDHDERERFRGTAAHNTIRIDGFDQATPAGPFRWLSPPAVAIEHWFSDERYDLLEAACDYRGFRHRRRFLLWKQRALLLLLDEVTGGGGDHRIERFWHFGVTPETDGTGCYRSQSGAILTLEETEPGRLTSGWRSPALGAKVPAWVVVEERTSRLPLVLAATLSLAGDPVRAAVRTASSGLECRLSQGWNATIRFGGPGEIGIEERP